MKSNLPTKYIYLLLFFFIITDVLITNAQSKDNQKLSDNSSLNIFMSQEDRREGIFDRNRLRTVFYNYGSVGRPNTEPSFEWPRESGHGYAYEIGLMIGAEVTGSSGETFHIFSEGLIDGGDRAPDGKIWGWQPIPQFLNSSSNTPAMSNNENSWPLGWTTWPGLIGNGIVSADLESYWVMDDRDNDEYKYYPFPGDSSKRGLGLEVKCRGFQWNNMFDDDFIIFMYNIKNIGEKSLNKVVVGIFGDPHVGGTGDFADDFAGFDRDENMVFSWDKEGSGNDYGIPWDELGWLGVKFLETPKNSENLEIGLTNFEAPIYASQNGSTANDAIMWNVFTPENFDESKIKQERDNVILAGSGYFSLAPGDSQTFSIAYIMGKGKAGLMLNAENAKAAYSLLKEIETPIVEILAPVKDTKIDSNYTIHWTTTNPHETQLSIDLYYTFSGSGEQLIKSNLPDNGSYFWNTTSLESGTSYKIGIIAKDSSSTGKDQSDYFTIYHQADSTSPEIQLIYPKSVATLSGQENILWSANDADGDTLTINIYYSSDNGITWQILAEKIENTGSYLWDTTKLPNGNTYKIKLSVADGTTEVESQISSVLTISNDYNSIADSLIWHIRGEGDGIIEVNIVAPSNTTGHNYQITFDDTSGAQTTYDVLDMDTNRFVVEDSPQLDPDFAGPLFDGLRLVINSIEETTINKDNTGWISGNPNISVYVSPFPQGGIRYPADYEVQFFDTIVDTSILVNPQPINFKVWNVTDQEQMDIVFYDNDGNSELSINDKFVIIHHLDNTATGSWQIEIKDPLEGEAILPQAGDILFIQTLKSFSYKDMFQFKSINPTGLKDKLEPRLPDKFYISQNFPNPFNSTTKYLYGVAKPAHVWITIFDITGREIRRLIDKKHSSGTYQVVWDGTNSNKQVVASGIYFYLFKSGNVISLKKCLLVK
jgi:FlgD Ig-like domain/Kre9/KNH-like N-terminal Ig-like domain